MKIMHMKWVHRFIEMAWHVADWSKDPSTKVGCIVVNDDGAVLTTGYNGLPRGVIDNADRMKREDGVKYLWTAHAEQNAISNAAMNGVRLKGATAFVTHHPCSRCAGMLVNAGVKHVVVGTGKTNMPSVEFDVARIMFEESGTGLSLLWEGGHMTTLKCHDTTEKKTNG
jgi:dCMP deaminase